MNTTLARKTRATEDRIAGLEHASRIAAAMAPDPREWAHNGEVSDCGKPIEKCVCGHPIRYIFWVERERDGRKIKIGSTCIESTVPYLISAGAEGLADALKAALAEHKEAIREQARRERAAQTETQITEILADWTALCEWVRDARQAYSDSGVRWRPGIIYSGMMDAERGLNVSAASTPGRTAASLRTRYQGYWEDAWRIGSGRHGDASSRVPLMMPPAPRELKLLAKLIKTYRAEAKDAEGRIDGACSDHYESTAKTARAKLADLGEEGGKRR